jgi:hypothetical protein
MSGPFAVRHGKGVHYYSNGDVYDGEFLENKRVGKSRLRFADGAEYFGQFMDDEVEGVGIYTDPEGNRFMNIEDEKDKKIKIIK